MKNHGDLDVWKRAIDLAVVVYQVTGEFRDDEKYGLASQMRRAAVSIASNIAEGDIHYTPKHGSWLNMAEIELSVLKSLNRRIAEMATMQAEVAAWEKHRNSSTKKINWRFTTADARVKLARLYPKL